jgi:hypothetical protein
MNTITDNGTLKSFIGKKYRITLMKDLGYNDYLIEQKVSEDVNDDTWIKLGGVQSINVDIKVNSPAATVSLIRLDI